MTWSEQPFFVPFGEDHLSAVATLPSTPPQGLAVLLQGLGAPRSHRYSLWTRIARTVADRGLASVRFDYRGMGDSTGRFVADLTAPPTPEAIAVVERTMAILEVTRVAVVGNCMGARTALGVALHLESCDGIGFIFHDSLQGVMLSPRRSGPTRGGSRLVADASSLLRRARRSLRKHASRSPRFLPEVSEAVSRMDSLFLFVGEERVRRMLERGLASIGPVARRPAFEALYAEPTAGVPFQLSLEDQDQVASRVSSWLEDVLLPPAGGSSQHPTRLSATPEP